MTLGVLLAHGSPDPRSARWVACAAAGVADRAGFRVVPAYLDHDTPRLAEAVVAEGGQDVRVLPLLLSTAFHARVDVPAAVAAVPGEVALLPPVGHPPALLDHVLRRAEGPAIVVAAGTSDDDERAAFAAAVASASERVGTPASAAFATAGPRVAGSAPGTAVVPWLLAPGRLLDAVVAAAHEAGLVVVGGPLLDEPLLLDHLAVRLTA